MKTRLYTAAIAASLVAVFAQSSYAATVSINTESASSSGFAGAGFITPAASSTGNYIPSTSGNVFNSQKSPFLNPSTAYQVLGAGSGPAIGTATFNYAAGITSFAFLWGSPDTHNSVQFFSGQNGTGSSEGIFTGSSLTHATLGTGYDLVSFLASTPGAIESVVLSNSIQPAFEFGNVTATPLPAALPLFASALGIGGIFLRLRKKKAAKSQVAFA
jgi:hypothetical protein